MFENAWHTSNSVRDELVSRPPPFMSWPIRNGARLLSVQYSCWMQAATRPNPLVTRPFLVWD
ncbi:hypothetical protein PISMIDRAFT_687787 [Pisolithus microcarpus 441]|uniref:Uncharacterized protein n=1 Tax=Pisolithus microcarpus 441 TaxID=765257 RepID=A0A0C9XQU1_9AGAM|nr:hypothetical protein PISMIDRAFT_687787 [Pisolithus microcarpus 441]